VFILLSPYRVHPINSDRDASYAEALTTVQKIDSARITLSVRLMTLDVKNFCVKFSKILTPKLKKSKLESDMAYKSAVYAYSVAAQMLWKFTLSTIRNINLGVYENFC
jgi:hypothetical protein